MDKYITKWVYNMFIFSGPVAWYEFNGDFCFVIGLTQYGNFSNIHVVLPWLSFNTTLVWQWLEYTVAHLYNVNSK